ncbi:MAG: hypothetical protein IJ498_05720 [Akkermansia sp.]|nr:hypothetical protein [Akkermansia sp.]
MNKSCILAAVAAFVGLSPMISAEPRTVCDTVTINRDDDLKWNKKAIQVSIARNKKEVLVDYGKMLNESRKVLGVTTPSPGVLSITSHDDVKKFHFSVKPEVFVLAKNVNSQLSDQNKYENIMIRVTLGHEETHAYDIENMPLICFHGGIMEKIVTPADKKELQRLYDEITIYMEARAVFNGMLTYAAYLKHCQQCGQNAYSIASPNIPISAASLKSMSDADLITRAYSETLAKYRANNYIRNTKETYAGAFKRLFQPDPGQYAIKLGFNFQPAKGYVTPERVKQLDPRQQDKLLKQYEQYENFAMEMLQKYQGATLIEFANSESSMELACELFVSHPCQLVEILKRVQDKDSAEAVSAASDALLRQWLAHFNAIKSKSDAAPALSSNEAMVFMFKVIPMRNQVYQQALMPEFERLRRANYYNSAALKDCVLKSENALIALNNEQSNSARKEAKEVLGQ